MALSSSDHESDRTVNEPKSDATKIVRAIFGEPLFQFLIVAGLLFAAQTIFAKDDREVIVVETATQQYLFDQEAELLLRPLTEVEKKEIVRNFIEEEILVREAVKRGFSDSSRIRALLLQNMRFFIAGDIPEPTEAELQEYFENNSEKFQSPLSYDFEHVTFASSGDVPETVINDLNEAGAAIVQGNAGIYSGGTLRYMDQRRLVQAFGAETAKEILKTVDKGESWHGPFLSQTGTVHFLKVSKENPPSLPDFLEVKDWVGTQWLSDKSRELMDKELQAVESDYVVEIVPPSGNEGD